MRKLAYILPFLWLALSCKKDTFIDYTDFGYAYQPQSIGYWIEYEVDSIFYDDVTTPSTVDTSHYFIREVYDTTFVDASGNENIRVEILKRKDTLSAWQVAEVGSVHFSETDYQRYFKDLRFVNLTFPVRVGKEWQGNAFLDVMDEPTLEYLDDSRYDWTYEYISVDEPYTINGFTLDSCATIIQIDDENLFEKKYSKEVYAKNIGLVHKEMIFLETQAPPSGQTFFERAESGFILEYKLKDYSN